MKRCFDFGGFLNVLRKANYKVYSHKDKKGLRNLIVRGFKGSYQCTLVTGKEEIPQAIIDELMKIMKNLEKIILQPK